MSAPDRDEEPHAESAFSQLNKRLLGSMNVRTISHADAEAFIALCKEIDSQTQFMLLEPGERTTTLEEQGNMITTIFSRKNQMIFVAEEGGRLLGFMVAMGGIFARNRRCASLVMGVLHQNTRRGIGTRLLDTATAWASANGIRRLELTVMAHNSAAIGLYTKHGFTTEGTRRQSIYIDTYIDEYYMSKLL